MRWLYVGGITGIGLWLCLLLTGYHVIVNVGQSLASHMFVCRPLRPEESLVPGNVVRFRVPDAMKAELEQAVPGITLDLPWLKQVRGVPGDTVCWEGQALVINGIEEEPLTLLRIYPLVRRTGCTVLREGELLLTGTHPHSYDSRYSGPVARKEILDRCYALL